MRRVVADTWRSGGTLSEATARLKVDFGVEPLRGTDVAHQRLAVERFGIRVVRIGDAEFPAHLAAVPDPPIALFVQGCVAALANPISVAVIGSRRASASGRIIARALARDLGSAGAVIVSGLALGIDGCAHRGALDAGASTVAVLGGGHGNIYPPSHRGLAAQIVAASGAVVSEYPPYSPPTRGNFPERNRIISGLAAGVVVVEATLKSGTLITARMALEQGREVMAVPGAVSDGQHGGCHRLIQQGAALVENVTDVLEAFGLHLKIAAPRDAPADSRQARILAAVPTTVTSLSVIVASLAMPVDEVLGGLAELEMDGFVETHRGGYIRRPPTNRDMR